MGQNQDIVFNEVPRISGRRRWNKSSKQENREIKKNPKRQVQDKELDRENENITGDVVIIHLEVTQATSSLSLPHSSSVIINSFSHSFIIVICSVQCALLAMLSVLLACAISNLFHNLSV